MPTGTAMELAGKRIGKDGVWLVLVKEQSMDGPRRRKLGRLWRCECLSCGGEFFALTSDLTAGRRLDCGCRARARFEALTPAQRRDRLRWRHHEMVARCTNPDKPDFPLYGGRDIRVCEGLLSKERYVAHLGDQPGPGMTVERQDNDGHYSCGKCEQCLREGWPDNVGWATRTQQALNRRPQRKGNGGRAPRQSAKAHASNLRHKEGLTIA